MSWHRTFAAGFHWGPGAGDSMEVEPPVTQAARDRAIAAPLTLGRLLVFLRRAPRHINLDATGVTRVEFNKCQANMFANCANILADVGLSGLPLQPTQRHLPINP